MPKKFGGEDTRGLKAKQQKAAAATEKVRLRVLRVLRDRVCVPCFATPPNAGLHSSGPVPTPPCIHARRFVTLHATTIVQATSHAKAKDAVVSAEWREGANTREADRAAAAQQKEEERRRQCVRASTFSIAGIIESPTLWVEYSAAVAVMFSRLCMWSCCWFCCFDFVVFFEGARACCAGIEY